MTGHRSALRVAVAAVVGAALLTAPATPAHAQLGQPSLELANVGNVDLQVGGGPQSVELRVDNRGNTDATGVGMTMTVPLGDVGVHISSGPDVCGIADGGSRMDCQFDVPAGGSWTGVAQVAVHGNSNLLAGDSRTDNGEVVLTGGFTGSRNFRVRVQGPDQPPGVAEVSGFVTDENTGEPIADARVLLVDGQGSEFTATTDDDGRFRFAGQEIAAGSIGLRASKDGFEGQNRTEQVPEGGSLQEIQLTLRSTATPTPTASATPTPTATASPTVAPAPAPDQDDSSGGLSFFTRLMIILGILFVLLGVGAIALLIYRRRKEAREDDDGEDGLGAADPTSGPTGPGPAPGSRGVYRPTPTQVHGGGPATAVQPQTAAMADAPTMLQPRAGADDATALHPRSGGPDDATAMHPRSGGTGADETALLPRAGGPAAPTRPLDPGQRPGDPAGARAEPPGPRPPAPGSPPPPRSAAPTYGTGQRGQPYGSPASTSGGGYGAAGPEGPPGRASHGGVSDRPERGEGYGPDPYTQPSAGRRGGAHDYGTGGYESQDRHPHPGSYDHPTQPSRPAHHQAPGPGDAGRRGPGHPDPDYREPDYREPDYRGAGYPGSAYQEPAYHEPGHRDPRYQEPGYREPTYPEPTYQSRGYQDTGYGSRDGYPERGYDRREAGYEPAYEPPGYGDSGYDHGGQGYAGYDSYGYGRDDQGGYGPPGYEHPGYDPGAAQPSGYPTDGRDGYHGYGRAGQRPPAYGGSGYEGSGYEGSGYEGSGYEPGYPAGHDHGAYYGGEYEEPTYGGGAGEPPPPRRPRPPDERRPR